MSNFLESLANYTSTNKTKDTYSSETVIHGVETSNFLESLTNYTSTNKNKTHPVVKQSGQIIHPLTKQKAHTVGKQSSIV